MNASTGRKVKISIGLGGASLLMILTVLALTAFAVLSLATATAQRRLAEKNADYVQSYYAADYQAEKLKREIALGLRQSRSLSEDPAAYSAFWAERLEGAAYDSARGELSCSISLNEGQVLRLVFDIDPQSAIQRTESWHVEILDTGDYVTPLNIWPGY